MLAFHNAFLSLDFHRGHILILLLLGPPTHSSTLVYDHALLCLVLLSLTRSNHSPDPALQSSSSWWARTHFIATPLPKLTTQQFLYRGKTLRHHRKYKQLGYQTEFQPPASMLLSWSQGINASLMVFFFWLLRITKNKYKGLNYSFQSPVTTITLDCFILISMGYHTWKNRYSCLETLFT